MPPTGFPRCVVGRSPRVLDSRTNLRPRRSRLPGRPGGVHLGLGAKDAELVALGVGEHGPPRAGPPLAAQVVDHRGAGAEHPRDLLVAGAGAWTQVEVHAVLDDLLVG